MSWRIVRSWKGQALYLCVASFLPIIIFIVITVYDAIHINKIKGDSCAWGYFPCYKSPEVCIKQENFCDEKNDCPKIEDDEDVRLCGDKNNFINEFLNIRNTGNLRNISSHHKSIHDIISGKSNGSLTTLLTLAYPREQLTNSTTFTTITSSPTTTSLSFVRRTKSQLHYDNINSFGFPTQNRTPLPATSAISTETCPEKCYCRSKSLACVNGDFSYILMAELKDIQKLVFKKTSIQILKKEMFKRTKNLSLKSINLSNQVHTIEVGVFGRIPTLKYLTLKNNRIKEILPYSFKGLHSLVQLDLADNQIESLHAYSFDGLFSLAILLLDSNKITVLPDSENFFPAGVIMLMIEENKITKITKRHFDKTLKLSVLSLRDNHINDIEVNIFQNCLELKDVDISRNSLEVLPRGLVGTNILNTITYLRFGFNSFTSLEEVLISLNNLSALFLEEVPLKNMKESWFNNLMALKAITFKSFDMCRYTPNVVVCRPHTDGISSFTNLLNDSFLGFCIWIVALLTCVGNLLVMICRIVFREEKNVHSLFIKNLAATDFMLGIYLLVIACHDVMYRDQYNAYAVMWMQGWTCQIAGFMGLMALEVSVFILTCMSFECCLTVSLPFKPRIMTVTRATVALMLMWLAGAFLAGFPIIFSEYFGEFYGGNGVCLPLHIHDPFNNGWQYSTFILICINVVGMLIIIVCYLIILFSFRKTHSMVFNAEGGCRRNGMKHVEKHLTRRMHRMDKRMFVIVLTNVLCWIPIIVIKILALNSIRIEDVFYAWLAIFVVPINSALNPIIYSITTANFRQKFIRNVDKMNGNLREVVSVLGGKVQKGLKTTRNTQRLTESTAASLLALPDIMLFHKYRTSSTTTSRTLNNQDSQEKIEILPNDSPMLNYHYKDVVESVNEEDEEVEKDFDGNLNHGRHVDDIESSK